MADRLNPADLVRRLEEKGVPGAQAQAHVDVLRDVLLGELAARGDVTALADALDGLRKQLADVQRGQTTANQDMRTDFDAWRAELDQRFDVLAGAIAAGASGASARQSSGGFAWWFITLIGVLCVLLAGFAAGILAPPELVDLITAPFG